MKQETLYELQRFVGIWETELIFDSKEKAKEELEFHKKLYNGEKWRLAVKKVNVVYEKKEDEK